MGLQNLIVGYEDWLYKTVDILSLPQNSAIIDVGANIGQTLLKIVPFNRSIKYIAIEPNIYCKTYLEKLCKLNNLTNVKVLLAHGWGSRASHMGLLTRSIVDAGFQVFTFDAPAHSSVNSKPSKTTSSMFEFGRAISTVANYLGDLHATTCKYYRNG